VGSGNDHPIVVATTAPDGSFHRHVKIEDAHARSGGGKASVRNEGGAEAISWFGETDLGSLEPTQWVG
jgi:hypothetical protein